MGTSPLFLKKEKKKETFSNNFIFKHDGTDSISVIYTSMSIANRNLGISRFKCPLLPVV